MKIETYEAFFDGLIEKSIMFLWYLVHTASALAGVFVIYLGIGAILLEPLSLSIWIAVTVSCSMAVPTTLFHFYYRKAKRLYDYDVSRLRDFWLGFSVSVELDSRVLREKRAEVERWIKDNISHMHKRDSRYEHTYRFASKADAVAFKLMWIE